MENKEELKPRRKFNENVFGIIILTILIMIASGIIVAGENSLQFIPNPIIRQISIYYTARISEILIMLIIFCIFKSTRYLVDKLSFTIKVIPAIIFGVLLNGICVLPAILNKDIVLTFDNLNYIILIYAILSVGIQCASEEILTRLYMFDKLKRNYKSPWIAILVNSALFSILHIFNDGINVTALISIFFIGILFSLLMLLFDDIWVPIGVHTGWNFMQAFILGLPNSGLEPIYSVFKVTSSKNSLLYNSVFGIEATITVIIVLILFSVLTWLLCKKKKAI